MPKTQVKSAQNRILSQPAAAVKARIVAASIQFGDLATAASISQSTVSHHLSGARKNRDTQLRIWDAFCRLSEQRTGFEEFWGDLLSRKAAS